MTDTGIREKVARAILESDPTCNYDKCKQRLEKAFARGDTLEKNWWESLHKQADSALLAMGYKEMREALEKLLEYEPVREEFQSAPKGDRQFANAKADWAFARSALEKCNG